MVLTLKSRMNGDDDSPLAVKEPEIFPIPGLVILVYRVSTCWSPPCGKSAMKNPHCSPLSLASTITRTSANLHKGAVSDADAIDAYLRCHLGVPGSRIINLRDKEATREGIIRGFHTLQNNLDINNQDAMLIYFAGHGSETKAPAGWEAGGCMVQVILPQDTGAKLSSGHIVQAIPDRTVAALLCNLACEKGNNIVRLTPSTGIALIEYRPWCGSDTLFNFRPLSSTVAILHQEPAMITMSLGALHVSQISRAISL